MGRADELIEDLERLQAEVDYRLGFIRSDHPDIAFEAGLEWSVPLQPSCPVDSAGDRSES